MGAAHLEHLVELPSLGEEGLLELAQRLHVALQPEDQPEVESRRIDVICRLPEVHMVVGIDVLVLAFLVAQNFEREIGDHLVGVHVGRRARTTLNEVRHELVEHLARDHADRTRG